MYNFSGLCSRVSAPSVRPRLYAASAALLSVLGGWHFLIPEGASWARLSLALPLSALLLYSFFRAVFRLCNPHLSHRQETAAAFLFVFFQSLGFYFDEGRYLANLGLLPAGLLFVRAALLTPLAAASARGRPALSSSLRSGQLCGWPTGQACSTTMHGRWTKCCIIPTASTIRCYTRFFWGTATVSDSPAGTPTWAWRCTAGSRWPSWPPSCLWPSLICTHAVTASSPSWRFSSTPSFPPTPYWPSARRRTSCFPG